MGSVFFTNGFFSFNWIDFLNDYLENANESKNRTTKQNPNEIWRTGRDKVEKVRVNENEITLNNNKILQQVKNRIQTRNEKIFTQHKT